MKKKSEHADKTIRHRSTFAILFYINRTKMRKDGTCQLLCKVSIDAEWEQIGTKVSVNPDIWNPEKGLANGRSANAVTVNRAIDELTEEITGHYNRIKNSLGFITAELVKNAVMGVGLKPLTLLALFREHNEDFRRRVGLDRIKETLDSYLRSYKHLSAFIKDKKGVEDVTLRKHVLPKNSLLIGEGRIQGERLHVNILQVEYGGTIIPVKLAVYDNDGQEGIFIPGSMEANAVKEVAANLGQNLGTSISITNQSAGDQLLSELGKGAIQGVSQYISRKMREEKVHLKSGYTLMLYQNDNQ